MLKFIKSFFTGKKEEPAQEAPYKVETPAPKAEVSAVATQAVVESIAKPAKAKKPAAKKAGNKPRKPKAPKAPKA